MKAGNVRTRTGLVLLNNSVILEYFITDEFGIFYIGPLSVHEFLFWAFMEKLWAPLP